MFGGYLQSQVKCARCHHASNTYDPVLDISLDIQSVGSVEHALSEFVKPETLDIDNAYKCERYQSTTPYVYTSIYVVISLVIHLLV